MADEEQPEKQEDVEQRAIAVLTGLTVNVMAGKLLGDSFDKSLTADGARDVVDRLKARDLKIVRAT
jgi:hypothetical protein